MCRTFIQTYRGRCSNENMDGGSDWVLKYRNTKNKLEMQNDIDGTIVQTRRKPVQRAVERDEIPYPYKVHDTTMRPLLNITIKSTIVVRSRGKSCGGGDSCGTTPA